MCENCERQHIDDILDGLDIATQTQSIDNNLGRGGNKRIVNNMLALLKTKCMRDMMSNAMQDDDAPKPHRINPSTINNERCQKLTNMTLDQLDGIATFTLTKMAQHTNMTYSAAVKRIDKMKRNDNQLIPVVVDRNDGDETDDDETDEVCFLLFVLCFYFVFFSKFSWSDS